MNTSIRAARTPTLPFRISSAISYKDPPAIATTERPATCTSTTRWRKCGAETYGSLCYYAGTGTQSTPCESPDQCSAGYVCVASGAGNQCVQLCSLTEPGSCPDGMVCEAVDVPGYGGCL